MGTSQQIGAALAALLLGACATAPVPVPASDRLAAAKDESSVERAIGKYLEARDKGIHPTYREQDGDLILEFLWEMEGGEPTIFIDTWPSEKDSAKQAIERAIQLRLLTRVIVLPFQRAKALELINDHNWRYWGGTFFLNPETGEIQATWTLNITAEGSVHPDSIYDALVRFIQSWKALNEQYKLQVAGAKETS